MKKTKTVEENVIPELDTHPHEWFEFWDVDGSGTLELHEVRFDLVLIINFVEAENC